MKTVVKTAISVPDPLFRAANDMAAKLGISRSQLYSKAVEAFIQAHSDEQITATLNRVYSQHSSELDPGIARLQASALPKDEW